MHIKHWVTVLGLVPLLGSYSAIAQASQAQDERELLLLCTRSPYNSRCQGQDWPTLLIDRPGITTACQLLRDDFRTTDSCKIHVEADQLTMYGEVGDPIADLDNQHDTKRITIPFDQIFAVSVRVWSVRRSGLLTGWERDDKTVLTLNYLTNAAPTDNDDYRSNVLIIFSDAEDGFPLGEQLMQLSPASRADAIASQLSAVTEPPLSGAAAIAQLLDTNACPRCDLSHADLSGEDLDRANLEGANLEGANLAESKLKTAYLTGANLTQANLSKADLSNARLPLTTLVEANLQDANLSAADLQWANLQSANLVGIKAELTAMQEVNLSQADLSQADLEGVNLFGANLSGANLTEANLSDKAPHLVNTYGFNLAGLGLMMLFGPSTSYRFVTDLSAANLQNANLTGANLEDVLFVNTNLRNANFTGVDLSDTDLSSANLCGATLPDGSSSTQGC